MKNCKFLVLAISLVLLSTSPSFGWAFQTYQKLPSLNNDLTWQGVLNYAQEHLPMEGQLLKKSNGLIYLKVDDDYIHTLFPLLGLKEEGFKKPPYFCTQEAIGAHISVIRADENKDIPLDEVGQYFRFELKQIVIVKPAKDKSYAVIQVAVPELEKLRQKYGLGPKPHGHEYHISLAIKTPRHAKKRIQ